MSLTDYFSGFFISDDQVATEQQVADAQAARLREQYSQGKISLWRYLDLTGDALEAGNGQENYRDDNSGFLRVIPWWVWLVAVGLIAWQIGGFVWLKNRLAK